MDRLKFTLNAYNKNKDGVLYLDQIRRLFSDSGIGEADGRENLVSCVVEWKDTHA